MDQKIIRDFINTAEEMKKLMEKQSSINYDTKVVPKLQFFAIKHISQHPNITVGELADMLMMSSGSIAQLIERLTSKGWIKKEVDEKDKRIFHISLTSKGEKEISKMEEIFQKKVTSMLSLISEKDLEEIVRIQKDLLEKLKGEEI